MDEEKMRDMVNIRHGPLPQSGISHAVNKLIISTLTLAIKTFT